jgi:hypothetical protein
LIEVSEKMKGLGATPEEQVKLRSPLLAAVHKIPKSKEHIFSLLQAAQLCEQMKVAFWSRDYFRIVAQLHTDNFVSDEIAQLLSKKVITLH